MSGTFCLDFVGVDNAAIVDALFTFKELENHTGKSPNTFLNSFF